MGLGEGVRCSGARRDSCTIKTQGKADPILELPAFQDRPPRTEKGGFATHLGEEKK